MNFFYYLAGSPEYNLPYLIGGRAESRRGPFAADCGMEQEVNYEQEKIKIRFENGTYNAVRYKWQKTKHRSCVRVSSSAAQLSSSFGKVMYTYSKYSVLLRLHYVGC